MLSVDLRQPEEAPVSQFPRPLPGYDPVILPLRRGAVLGCNMPPGGPRKCRSFAGLCDRHGRAKPGHEGRRRMCGSSMPTVDRGYPSGHPSGVTFAPQACGNSAETLDSKIMLAGLDPAKPPREGKHDRAPFWAAVFTSRGIKWGSLSNYPNYHLDKYSLLSIIWRMPLPPF